jgi:hypothetical protein
MHSGHHRPHHGEPGGQSRQLRPVAAARVQAGGADRRHAGVSLGLLDAHCYSFHFRLTHSHTLSLSLTHKHTHSLANVGGRLTIDQIIRFDTDIIIGGWTDAVTLAAAHAAAAYNVPVIR